MNEADRIREVQDMKQQLMNALVRITALEDELRELKRAQPDVELETAA